jgi:riboflavin kinase/FMN adenylyltransferase
MEIIFGLGSYDHKGGPSAMTLGNFDGMHIGHEALVRSVKTISTKEKIRGGLMTFDPHPLKVVAPEKQIKSIFDISEKIARVKELGLDFFVIEPFSRELSETSPEDFFKAVVKTFDVKFLIVGHDFNFGRNRSGTLDLLKSLCKTHKINLEILPPVKINGEVVSSTQIRNAITNGDVEKANLFLGHAFFLRGVIEKGAARGRTIGFPTANLFTKAELVPKNGVYITLFSCKGKDFHSMTNIGQNPTFKESQKRLVKIETHIFDFDEDIYGEQAVVKFLKYIRPEIKFNSVDELIANIKNDEATARAFSWAKK